MCNPLRLFCLENSMDRARGRIGRTQMRNCKCGSSASHTNPANRIPFHFQAAAARTALSHGHPTPPCNIPAFTSKGLCFVRPPPHPWRPGVHCRGCAITGPDGGLFTTATEDRLKTFPWIFLCRITKATADELQPQKGTCAPSQFQAGPSHAHSCARAPRISGHWAGRVD